MSIWKIRIKVIFFFLLSAFFPKISQAAILPACVATSDCKICDIFEVAINIGLFILAVSGAITLFFIVYGGFMWLISGGSPDKITKGKNILINAALGLTIAFTAYVMVVGLVALVTNNWQWQTSLRCS